MTFENKDGVVPLTKEEATALFRVAARLASDAGVNHNNLESAAYHAPNLDAVRLSAEDRAHLERIARALVALTSENEDTLLRPFGACPECTAPLEPSGLCSFDRRHTPLEREGQCPHGEGMYRCNDSDECHDTVARSQQPNLPEGKPQFSRPLLPRMYDADEAEPCPFRRGDAVVTPDGQVRRVNSIDVRVHVETGATCAHHRPRELRPAKAQAAGHWTRQEDDPTGWGTPYFVSAEPERGHGRKPLGPLPPTLLWVDIERQCRNVSPDKKNECTIERGHVGAHVAIDPMFGLPVDAWPGTCPETPISEKDLAVAYQQARHEGEIAERQRIVEWLRSEVERMRGECGLEDRATDLDGTADDIEMRRYVPLHQEPLPAQSRVEEDS